MEEDNKDEGWTRIEGEEEAEVTSHTQLAEALRQKKAMRAATPQTKVIPNLTMDNAREMFSNDTTIAFREQMKLKGNKLYSEQAVEETITISSEDEDDMSLQRKRGLPPSPFSYRIHCYGEDEAKGVDRGGEVVHLSLKNGGPRTFKVE